MKMILVSAARWFGILYISVSFVKNDELAELRSSAPNPPRPRHPPHVNQPGSSESQPVHAFTGEEVILPCHMNLNLIHRSINNPIVEWTRSDQTQRMVHIYKDGQDYFDYQHDMFKGRTSLFQGELKNGNFSLKLSRVTTNDTDEYKCKLPMEGLEKTIKLQVDTRSKLHAESEERNRAEKEKLQADNEKLQADNAKVIDKKKAAIIQHFTKVMFLVDLLLQNNSITKEDHTRIKQAGTRQDQMTQLYQVLDKRGVTAKSAFFMILMKEDHDFLNLPAGSTWIRGQITGVIIAVIVAVLAASAVV